jgi:predicted restriction endonuclease
MAIFNSYVKFHFFGPIFDPQPICSLLKGRSVAQFFQNRNRLSGNHETEPALTELNTVVVKRLPSVFQTVKPSFTHRSEGIWQKDYLTFGFAYLA